MTFAPKQKRSPTRRRSAGNTKEVAVISENPLAERTTLRVTGHAPECADNGRAYSRTWAANVTRAKARDSACNWLSAPGGVMTLSLRASAVQNVERVRVPWLWLVLVVVLCVPATATAAPRLWLKPSKTNTLDKVPAVDGVFGLGLDTPEYTQGRWFTLANWRGDGALNGTMYMQVQDAIAAPMPLEPRTLFIGLHIPRKMHENQAEDTGQISLYLDTDRMPLTALRSGWPNPDRKIVLTFTQPGARADPYAPVSVVVSEFYATAATGIYTAELTGTNRMVRSAAMSALNNDFLFLEVKITLPQSAFDDARIGFALDYRDEGYQNNLPVFTVPNAVEYAGNSTIRFGDKAAWAEIDLVEPAFSTLGMGIYNAGQMVAPAGDGGEGEPIDIAKAIATRDLVCLTEVMHQDDRDQVFRSANNLRAGQDPPLLPFDDPVSGNPGDPPNNMILTSWYIVASQTMRFTAIRPEDERCTEASDEVGIKTRGSKGVVWARIAAPICRTTKLPAGPGGCFDENLRPEQPEASPDEWFDVFCTHTQAPYDFEGHEAEARDCQHMALQQFMTDRRSQPYLGKTGLDRPAILLGDMNQVGPRTLSDNDLQSASYTTWKDDDSDVFAPTSVPTYQLKSRYEWMRITLGNAYEHPFDTYNDDAIEDYDISANTGGEGSWIGEEYGASVSATTSDSCSPGVPGFPNMQLTPRVDYIMLIPPATDVYPAWAFRWDPAHAPRAFVDKHYYGGDVSGCVSDHAEVYAYVQPFRITDIPAYNPTKSHQVIYKVTYIADVYGSDGNDTDWYGSTAVEGPGGTVANHWSDEYTEDCRACDPRWTSVSAPFTGFQTATTWMRVRDWDGGANPNDQYDADPAVNCKEPTFNIEHASGDVLRTSCGGTPVWVGNLKASGGVLRGPALWTMGTGEDGVDGFTGFPLDVAAVKHEIHMCEVGLRCE